MLTNRSRDVDFFEANLRVFCSVPSLVAFPKLNFLSGRPAITIEMGMKRHEFLKIVKTFDKHSFS